MLPRLYAILDIDLLNRRQLHPQAVLDAWLEAGVKLIQLRAKSLASGAMLALADDMTGRCRSAGALCIVNDRADIARLSGADGVHLGQDDLAPDSVRRILPEPALIGLSTHTEAQMDAACRQPISYLAIGPVFETTSKAKPDPVVGLAGVTAAAARASARALPIVAIGGITLERAPHVIAAGAASVAVISDLLEGDLLSRAREYVKVLG